MITGELLKEWKRQAEKDGILDEYEYHLGMVENPFPYRLWRIKKASLDRIQSMPGYNEGKELPPGTVERETKLCQELGY